MKLSELVLKVEEYYGIFALKEQISKRQ